MRREQELIVEAKQLELEDGADKLEAELATGNVHHLCMNLILVKNVFFK